jgi:hypothetical protein
MFVLPVSHECGTMRLHHGFLEVLRGGDRLKHERVRLSRRLHSDVPEVQERGEQPVLFHRNILDTFQA